jgi:hypothetical protein
VQFLADLIAVHWLLSQQFEDEDFSAPLAYLVLQRHRISLLVNA